MKQLTLKEFVSQASPDDCRIFHVGDGHWEARCQAGVLVQPSGKSEFINLTDLLSTLADVGIRCCEIEWDGLPTKSESEEKSSEFLKSYQARVESGAPISSFLIESPFNCKVEDNFLHIDSPCLAAGGTNMAAVLRFSFTAGAAMGLRDYLNSLSFENNGGGSGSRLLN